MSAAASLASAAWGACVSSTAGPNSPSSRATGVWLPASAASAADADAKSPVSAGADTGASGSAVGARGPTTGTGGTATLPPALPPVLTPLASGRRASLADLLLSWPPSHSLNPSLLSAHRFTVVSLPALPGCTLLPAVGAAGRAGFAASRLRLGGPDRLDLRCAKLSIMRQHTAEG